MGISLEYGILLIVTIVCEERFVRYFGLLFWGFRCFSVILLLDRFFGLEFIFKVIRNLFI